MLGSKFKLYGAIFGFIAVLAIIVGAYVSGRKAGRDSEKSRQAEAITELRSRLAILRVQSQKRLDKVNVELTQTRRKYHAAILQLRAKEPDTAKWLDTPVPSAIVRLIWMRDDEGS